MNVNGQYNLISLDKKDIWNQIILSFKTYDIYHLAAYHQLAMEQGEGQPWLFYFSQNDHHAALPFLARPLSEVEGLEEFRQYDGTSVYGYPGILSSIRSTDSDAIEFKTNFQASFLKAMSELGIISIFIRQNPFFDTSWLLDSCAQVVYLGDTIAINLKMAEEDQLRQMTKGHRYDIRKARENGVTAREASFFDYLDIFMQIYNETMIRTKARDYYFFSKDYYLKLKEYLGEAVKLYIAELNNETISAAIFLVSSKIVNYHLSGSLTSYLPFCGSKVIIDEMRKWAYANGRSWMHLGGGVGSKEDSLYRFKAGFSGYRLKFEVIKLIIDPTVYENATRSSKRLKNNLRTELDFFPLYRMSL